MHIFLVKLLFVVECRLLKFIHGVHVSGNSHLNMYYLYCTRIKFLFYCFYLLACVLIHGFSIFQEFLCCGRFIFGPDIKSIFLTIFLIVAPVAVFCAFVARKLLDDFSHHSGYSIMIIVIIHTIFVS